MQLAPLAEGAGIATGVLLTGVAIDAADKLGKSISGKKKRKKRKQKQAEAYG